MYRVRGMGAAGGAGSIVSGSIINTGAGITVDCNQTLPYILNSGCWQYSPATWAQLNSFSANAAAVMVPPAVPPAPTQTQLDTCADPSLSSADAAACANALVSSLAAQAETQTQANINAAAQTAPPVSQPSPPFCGDGSTQWISGVDNCVLLAGGAVAIFLLAFASAPKFVTGGRN
jgi:hypothetical protein